MCVFFFFFAWKSIASYSISRHFKEEEKKIDDWLSFPEEKHKKQNKESKTRTSRSTYTQAYLNASVTSSVVGNQRRWFFTSVPIYFGKEIISLFRSPWIDLKFRFENVWVHNGLTEKRAFHTKTEWNGWRREREKETEMEKNNCFVIRLASTLINMPSNIWTQTHIPLALQWIRTANVSERQSEEEISAKDIIKFKNFFFSTRCWTELTQWWCRDLNV